MVPKSHLNLTKIVKYLEEISTQKKTKFVLITQSNHEESELRISYSSHFTDAQISEVHKLLSTERIRIVTIRPVLVHVEELYIDKKTTSNLIRQYQDLFHCINQNTCKEIAKRWIKVAEPNKQARFPYRDQNSSRPPWWPETTDHIEPDHLDKRGRVELLIQIIRNNKFYLESLRSSTSSMKFKREISQRILDEVYYIAAYERLFFNKDRHLDPIFKELKQKDKVQITNYSIILPVSKLRDSVCHGTIMASKIKLTDINNKVFALKSEHSSVLTTPESLSRSVSPENTLDQGPILEASERERRDRNRNRNRKRKRTRELEPSPTPSLHSPKIKKENNFQLPEFQKSPSYDFDNPYFLQDQGDQQTREESPYTSVKLEFDQENHLNISSTNEIQETTHDPHFYENASEDILFHIDHYSTGSSDGSIDFHS
ncbi:uncharacterized protein RJT21DRAFT_49001 [Scheffersomyces amazonensis]|uniref:uncharacterized protein n=1 Tax=Scheffersomyces amazonensis TaxID=1078765 RepID=UPI00315D969B